jgi:hypothetical protein
MAKVTRRRHFGSARKLPSGRWQGGYWHQGVRHVAAGTFPAKSDALAFLATKETDILRGEWITAAAGKARLGEFVDKWAEQHGHLRPRTVELYPYLVASHIRPTFDGYQLSAITNSQVGAWHRALALGRASRQGDAQARARKPEVVGRRTSHALASSGLTGICHGVGLYVLTLARDRICAMTRFENIVLPSFGLPRSLPSR